VGTETHRHAGTQTHNAARIPKAPRYEEYVYRMHITAKRQQMSKTERGKVSWCIPISSAANSRVDLES
jgi:hypothetical protein